MVNQEIVEGLRTALARGYPLQVAMMSFFNAGYKKEEIEEAARSLYSHPSQPLSHPGMPSAPEAHEGVTAKAKPILTKPLPTAAKPIAPAATSSMAAMPSVAEKAQVSKYEEKTKPKSKVLTFFLILSLIILIGALVGIFIFKNEVINFFNNLLA